MLDQPQYSADEVAGLQRCFALYVGMPKNRWKEIQKAEKNTPEGDRIFEKLKDEYKAEYLKPELSSSKDKSFKVADLENGLN